MQGVLERCAEFWHIDYIYDSCPVIYHNPISKLC